MRLRLWGKGGVLLATAAAACVAAIPAGADAPTPLLPDLDPIAPSAIAPFAATDGSGRVFLTFTFAYDNKGAGPLIVRGHRASTAEPMQAAQVVRNTDGTQTVGGPIGQLEWLPTTGYRRWGYTHHRYELVGESTTVVAPPTAGGLCLQDDRNSPGARLPGEPSRKVFANGCGKNLASIVDLDMGLSVGWRNLHSAGRLGQMIDITTLPSGTYTLVNRVNANGLLAESNLANDASSARVSITWVTDQALPTVAVLASCQNSATC